MTILICISSRSRPLPRLTVAGYLVDSSSGGGAKDYTAAFLLLGALLLLNLLVTAATLKITQPAKSQLVMADVLK